jgi:hypothetical protein
LCIKIDGKLDWLVSESNQQEFKKILLNLS